MKKENRIFMLLSIAAIMFLSLLTTTQQVQAQTFSGRAVGVQLNTTSQTSVPPATVTVLATATVADTGPLPQAGGTRSTGVVAAQVITTGVLNSTFTTGVLTSTTSGGLVDGVPTSTSQSTVNDVNLIIGGNTITATTLQANSQCTCSASAPTCTGNTVVENLVISTGAATVTLNGAVAPNTRIVGAVVTATVGTVTTRTTTDIIVNEQITGVNADGSTFITVNALRVTTTSVATDSLTGITTTTTTDIIIAQANSDINCTAQPVPPTAATAVIAGRLTVDTGFVRGSGRFLVTILNTRTLDTQVAFTDRLGYYQFNDLPVGDTYVITIRAKGYTFTPQTINLAEDSALDIFGTAVGRSGSKGPKNSF